MRVVGGTLRGRRLVAPMGLAVRPTPDKVREALFDILGERARGASFLDLFAGSGAVGIEALSRGAARVLLVDSGAEALRAIAGNLAALGIDDRVGVVKAPWPGGVGAASRRDGPFTIVFADPPFDRAPYEEILESVGRPEILAEGGIVILEHEIRGAVPEEGGTLVRFRIASYGRVGLAFYRRRGP